MSNPIDLAALKALAEKTLDERGDHAAAFSAPTVLALIEELEAWKREAADATEARRALAVERAAREAKEKRLRRR